VRAPPDVPGAASSSFADRAVLEATAAAAVAAFFVVRARGGVGFASAAGFSPLVVAFFDALPLTVRALVVAADFVVPDGACSSFAVDAFDSAGFFPEVAAGFLDAVVAVFRPAVVAGFLAAPVVFFVLDGRRAAGFDSTVSGASSRGALDAEPDCSSGAGFSGDWGAELTQLTYQGPPALSCYNDSERKVHPSVSPGRMITKRQRACSRENAPSNLDEARRGVPVSTHEPTCSERRPSGHAFRLGRSTSRRQL